MKLMNRSTWRRGAAALLCAAAALCGAAFAQDDYPSRPITLVVPFPAGGVTDVVARELAHRLSASLGQAVVVDNRAGASGNIGTHAVARAAPDGYTLGVLTVSALSIGPHLSRKLPFDPARDFTPITNLVNTPGAVIAAPGTPFNNFPEFVKHAKANPGRVTYASVGPGSIPHLTAEILAKAVKVDMVHVPYKGAAPAMQDLLANHVDLSFETSLATTMTYHASKRIKVLAVTGPNRVPMLPDVPTVAESGYPGFGVQGWFGFFGPRGLPPAIVDKLNKAAVQAFADPALRQRLEQLGMQPETGTPQQFRQFLAQQDKAWAEAVKDLKITLE
ncbi:Bug family tripartite tricarboxylate transporter substrate binding protein [Variovorax saccharolyticus]|uniref:Bug family tripartite tricarboxylate transporter substrate binding protein n=1 Tax=Variovorax saccharolyticus TaxID=3053516 RepID=UPI0025786046|nr:tripartite tricarboxylate transporter substrate binding protein [Variovorax sp. J22R187]MDM0021432.1 tripartite tricarboxylate transporter substrate binding protein [Variovorax sp. J22R187]